jgi:hypothetical protein
MLAGRSKCSLSLSAAHVLQPQVKLGLNHSTSSPNFCSVAQHVLQQLFPQHNTAPTADPASQQQQQAATGPAGGRFKGLLRQVAPSPACSKLVASEEFHLPLVECAVQLVAFIAGEVSIAGPAEVLHAMYFGPTLGWCTPTLTVPAQPCWCHDVTVIVREAPLYTVTFR